MVQFSRVAFFAAIAVPALAAPVTVPGVLPGTTISVGCGVEGCNVPEGPGGTPAKIGREVEARAPVSDSLTGLPDIDTNHLPGCPVEGCSLPTGPGAPAIGRRAVDTPVRELEARATLSDPLTGLPDIDPNHLPGCPVEGCNLPSGPGAPAIARRAVEALVRELEARVPVPGILTGLPDIDPNHLPGCPVEGCNLPTGPGAPIIARRELLDAVWKRVAEQLA